MWYIKEHTDVPVPFARNWNSNRHTLTGVEYVIMQKVDPPFFFSLAGQLLTCFNLNLDARAPRFRGLGQDHHVSQSQLSQAARAAHPRHL
jgi:hypothetical protein